MMPQSTRIFGGLREEPTGELFKAVEKQAEGMRKDAGRRVER